MTQQAPVPDVMQGVAPGWVMIGDPLIFGTPGRDAALGFPGLTAPGIAGWVTDGALPAGGIPDPIPVVLEGEGVDGATLGEGAPPGWVGAVPVPEGELVVCAWAGAANSRARPAAARIVVRMVMMAPAESLRCLLNVKAGDPVPFAGFHPCDGFVLRGRPQGEQMDEATESAGDLEYAYKPKLMGGVWMLRLAPDALHWAIGGMSGRVPYADIRQIRLAFRPVTMQSYRFLAEIWSDRNPKIPVASASWKSLMEQERQDEAYSRFITALHQRIAAARGTPKLQAGAIPFLYWPGFVIFVGICVAMLGLIVRAIQQGETSATLFLLGFFVFLLWQLGMFFKRNRPRRYPLDAIPADVLPAPAPATKG